jgi:hypothetical protein
MMMGSSAGKGSKLFDIAWFFSSSLARLAQSAERKALNLVVVGSSPTVGVSCLAACACVCVGIRGHGMTREAGGITSMCRVAVRKFARLRLAPAVL